MKKLILLLLVLITVQSFAQDPALSQTDTILLRVKNLEYSIYQIQRDQINYKIEKDLLKETYSRNYETINLLITLILGVIGAFAFLGIRDISSIKREYNKELEELRETKKDFEIKSKELEKDKGKFENEIKKIIETNENQNNKIKVLELKEKISKLIEDNKIYEALEYITVALGISPEDSHIYTCQGMVYTRLNQIDKAQNAFEKAVSIDVNNKSWIANLIEFYCLSNNFKKADELINNHKAVYDAKSSTGLGLIKDIFELYYKGDEKGLRDYIIKLIDKNDMESQMQRTKEWKLTEAKFVAVYQPDSPLKTKLQNVIWYLDGQINGNTLINRLGLPI